MLGCGQLSYIRACTTTQVNARSALFAYATCGALPLTRIYVEAGLVVDGLATVLALQLFWDMSGAFVRTYE